MSKKLNWNEGWLFTKEVSWVQDNKVVLNEEAWEKVNVPHTWNGKDGQDGGNDYYRGTCYYTKKLNKELVADGEDVYLEFEGANSSADVYVNGNLAVHHDGGYSTFRANITELLEDENTIIVAVDNAPNDRVYPQMADFTFYGGIYRDVNLLCVSKARFDLDYFGGPGITVTPVVEGSDAKVAVKAYFTGLTGKETVKFTVKDGDSVIAESTIAATEGTADFVIKDVHLWNAIQDPYLYSLEAVLTDGEKELDQRVIRFGCRYFEIHPEKGFILNGKECPLRGVSRHQDRPEIGNALLPKHHKEDLELIKEVGANTIRLAHYQHNQVVYDLSDEMGFVLWAEIPYISNHMPNGRENTISQMKELIVQNYNHPSIFVWGLSNEITMKGDTDPDLIENHHILNDLCHEMDKTRPTTMAIVSMCPMTSPYVQIPDTVAWNHYFGWYGGDTSMNGPWMDKFHELYPNLPVGMSEYGCEALNWHTSDPAQGDYTEEYQAYYHEELIKQLFTRPYLWATHVWNMFDFAADSRSEGGEDGMNHKGLVTFDRKYKKDSFYAYKAWLSEDPFVHICGKRYVDRVEDVTKVTVYSNQPEVELFANGVSLGKQTSDVHFFYFDVPNAGIMQLVAKAGELEDTSKIVKVEKFNDDYRMVETGDVLNWFEITEIEGYFSINDKMSELMSNEAAKGFLLNAMMSSAEGRNTMADAGSIMDNPGLMTFLSGFTVKRLLSMMPAMGGKPMTKDQMLAFNAALNQIKK
ncbi:MAG: glycoside hydrolase family 2 protein [Lachnospiraceae bacterium]|nr:glycoside hydrolase family 2 protein [Lachnospiraceae bacterium]